MGFSHYGEIAQRYSRTFNVADPNVVNKSFYFMAASTTGVAGDVVQYDTAEDTIAIATSGSRRDQVAGFLMQDVKDLDAGAVKGYRNMNNSVEHLGGNVSVLQDNTIAFTKRYLGTPAVGDRLMLDELDSGKLMTFDANNDGFELARVEATTSADTPNVEPTQLSSGGLAEDWIRIRIFGL